MTSIKRIAFALLATTAGAVATPALAGPLAVSPVEIRPDVLVEQVAYGCGPGWTLNRWGECRPMRRYGYYAPRPGYYAPAAPIRPVFHVGPFGAGISFY
ncbi:hypothetical protein [Methylobacterium sp. Leaf93]|uniref:GCG_CRPN prefix-to-repeats domain-containing protein n=1 Tax=Methylobacterium sp. Leaf93 TaxID=1736249 RepID=UPI0006F1DE83|nr:hypothetical protein [Methylobacterium sp. Leaf93]KQP00969.1 hypothetical protein ASF26_15485 [Methylobacterium sp. Leaf93]